MGLRSPACAEPQTALGPTQGPSAALWVTPEGAGLHGHQALTQHGGPGHTDVSVSLGCPGTRQRRRNLSKASPP